MPILVALSYRYLISKRARSLLTILAITVGTAVVSATLSTNSAIEESLHRTAVAIAGKADVLIEALDPEGFPPTNIERIRRMPTISVAAGRVTKRTFFRTTTARGFVDLLGVDPEADEQVHTYTFVAGRGLLPAPSHDVVVGDRWASRYGVAIGDSLELITREGFTKFQVVGIITEADPGLASSEGILRTHVATVQAAFQLHNRLQRFDLVLKDPADLPQLEQQLSAELDGQYILRKVGDIRQELSDSISDFRPLLFFFGTVATFVGAFLVYNTLTMNVADQAREIGLLRMVGATLQQIRLMALAQAFLLALGGTIPGALLGQALAVALIALFESLRQMPLTGSPFSITAGLWGIAIGTSMTFVAAIVPSWRAGRLSPTEALRTVATALNRQRQNEQARRAPVLLGSVLLLMLFISWPFNDVWRWLKAPALVYLFALLVSLSPVLADGISRLATRLVSPWSSSIMLVQRNFQREPSRTAATLAGFFISFAFVIGLTNMTESATTAGQRWVSSLFPGEYAIVAPVPQPLILVNEFTAVSGVEQASPVALNPIVWNGLRFTAAGLDPIAYASAFEFVEGNRERAFAELRRGNSVLIPAGFARDFDIKRGSSLRLRIGANEAAFTVVGVIAHSFPSSDRYGSLVLALEDLRRYGGDDSFQFIAVNALPDADPVQMMQELGALAEQYGLEAGSVQNLRMSVQQAIQLLLILFGGLVATGIVISSLGLANTMMMNIAGRTRELGILRAVGTTQTQVQLLMITEALMLGLIGALMGVVGSVFLGRLLVELARTPEFDPQFSFSPLVALVALGVGLVAALVAAWYPARRAASIKIVDALRFE